VKIYTKTGDSGMTGLYGSVRVEKNSLRIEVIGEVDELNACLGLAATAVFEPTCMAHIGEIQRRLFDLGAQLANPSGQSRAQVLPEDIVALETSIDVMTDQLPPLRAFILPGGSAGSAGLHLARTVCRRCERSLVELHVREYVPKEVLTFINRLSDWLFTAARFCNAFHGAQDVEWSPRVETHA
jgi:cob(I)alamin adenosyltransferase